MPGYYLEHRGVSVKNGAPIGSGRYRLGSGKRPFQHGDIWSFKINNAKESKALNIAKSIAKIGAKIALSYAASTILLTAVGNFGTIAMANIMAGKIANTVISSSKLQPYVEMGTKAVTSAIDAFASSIADAALTIGQSYIDAFMRVREYREVALGISK